MWVVLRKVGVELVLIKLYDLVCLKQKGFSNECGMELFFVTTGAKRAVINEGTAYASEHHGSHGTLRFSYKLMQFYF